MIELLPAWSHFEQVLDGERPDRDRLRFLLEDPGTYSLRRLLRRYPARDAVFSRLASFLRGGESTPTTDVFAKHRDELALAATFLGRDDLAAATRATPVVEADVRPEAISAIASDIVPLIEAAVLECLDGCAGGRALWHALDGACWDSVEIRTHLLAPLLGELGWPGGDWFGGYTSLMARGGTIRLMPSGFQGHHGDRPRRTSLNYVEAPLEWLDEATLRRDVDIERSVLADETVLTTAEALEAWLVAPMAVPLRPAAELAGLSRSANPRVRAAVARRSDLDPATAASLASDDDPRVRTAIAAAATRRRP